MSIKIDPEILETADVKDILEYAVHKHSGVWYEKMQDYYEGRHAILDRQLNDPTKPNNKLVTNLAKYIVDTVTGYFMGEPVSYSGDESYIEALTDVFKLNHEQDHNAELGKHQSIKGCAYELLYTDEDANIRLSPLPRESVIYIESNEVDAKPVMAIRIYRLEDLDGNEREMFDVYTDSEIVTYEKTNNSGHIEYVEKDRVDHFFQAVPVVQYKNNSEMIGDFEGVISLIDAYNISQSDTLNDFSYFSDAYLLLTGAELDPDDAQEMKQNRVITLPDKEADARFLIKDIADVPVENFKNRIREDIHTVSAVPDLSNDEFGQALSGVALAYKLTGLEKVVSLKERKFKMGLQRRIELITNLLNASGKQWSWQDITVEFSRNLPQNMVELTQIVKELTGHVDRETLLHLLPFVDDVQETIDRLQQEKEEAIDLSQYMTDDEEDEQEEE